MSRTVDKRVVEMEFDNAKFEQGVKQSTSSLEKLKQALNFDSTQRGLQQFQQSASALKLDNITSQLDMLTNRFSTLGIVGMTAIQNITNRVVDLGMSIGTKLINQIKQGGIARYQNIAQAKFQIEGLKKDWESLYEDMDYAVSGTAYGIDEAAAVASQLSASGLEAGDGMKAALRGISGVAAMSNSTYSEIGNIFTTVAGNGRLMGMQLTQLATKGLNVAATLAEALGTSEADIRDMVSKGEISFEMFAQAMDDAFGEHSKEANKTFTGALANMKSALSRIGENFARPIFENLITPLNTLREVFNEVKNKFSVFTGTLTDESWKHSSYGIFIERVSGLMDNLFKNIDLSFIDKFISHLDKLVTVINYVIAQYSRHDGLVDTLKAYAQVHSLTDKKTKSAIVVLEGLRNIGKAINNVFTSVVRVIQTIMKAFTNSSDIEDTANGFYELTEVLLKLSASFYITTERAQKIYSLFKKIFDTIKYFLTLVKNVVVTIGNYLAPVLSTLFDIFLDLTKTLGKLITKTGEFLKENIDVNKAAQSMLNIYEKLKEILLNVGDALRKVVDWYRNLSGHTKKVVTTLAVLLVLGSRMISWTYILDRAFHSVILTITNTLQLASNLSLFFSGMKNFTKYVGIAIIIKEIGVAIAILAASLFVLSMVDPNNLKTATACIGILLAAMVGLGVVLTVLASNAKDVNKVNSYLISLGASFMMIAAAILFLAKAVEAMSKAEIGKTWNSLAVLTVIIIELTAATVAMSMLAPVLSKGSIMLVAYAASVYILVKAINQLHGLDLNGVNDKLLIVGLAMLTMIGIAKLASKVSAKGTAGVLIMVASLWLIEKSLQYVVKHGVSWEQLQENFDKLGIALGTLIVLAAIMRKISSDGASVRGAIMIVALAASVILIAKAFEKLVEVTQGTDIIPALSVLIAMFVGISSMLKVINDAGQYASKAGSAVLKMGVAILLISTSLAILTKINNIPAMFASAAAIGVVLLSTATMLVAVSRMVEKTHIVSIIAMTVMVGIIAASLSVLTFFSGDGGKVLASAAAIGVVLLSITATLAAVSKYTKGINPTALAVINSMLYVIIAIATSLTILSHVEDVDKMYHSVAAIAMTLADLMAIMVLFGRLSEGVDIKKLELFDVAVATLIVVATSMLMLNQFESIGKLYATVGALSACLLAVALAVIGIGKFANTISVKAIVALGIAVLALIAIAASLKILLDGGYNWDEMKKAVTAMIAVLGAMVIALSLLAVVTKLTGGVATLVAGAVIITSLLALAYVLKTLGESVKILTLCLAALTKIDYEAIRIDILQELSNLLLTFGLKAIVAGAGLVVFGAGLGAVGVAMLAVSAALAIGVPMITLLIKSLIQLAKYAPLVATGIKIVGKAVAGASKDIANAVFIFLSTLLAKLSAFSMTLLASIDTICNAVVAICLKLVQSIAKVVVVGIELLCKEIANHLPTILKYLEKALIAILKFLYNVAEPLAEAAAVIISAFFIGLMNGIEKKLPELIDSFTRLAITALWAVTKALYDHQDDLMDAIKGILDVIGLTVMNMLDTLTGGLLSKMDWYKGTMDELSAEIEDLSAKRGKREAEANTNAYIKETENSKTKIHEAKKDNILDTYGLNEDAGKKDADGYVSGYTNTIGNGKITTAVSNVPSAVSEEMKKHSGDLKNAGSDIDDTVAEGVEENSDVVSTALSNMPPEAAEEMRKHGVDMTSIGNDIDESVAEGMTESDASTEGAEEVTDTILGVFNSDETSSKFSTSGWDTMGSFISGLVNGATDEEGQSKLRNAVNNLMQKNVVDEAAAAIDSHSPSKKGILLGKYWDLGVGQGITEYSKVVNDASKGTANGLVNSFSDALNNVNKGIDGNLKYEPTIRPVVDMTQVEQASNWLQTAFSNDASVRLAEDSTLSIQNGTNNSLANQVAALSDQVNKLASTDYSKLLEGVSVNVDARTSVDGTPLRMTSAKYTSQVMNDDQRAYIMAKGGRI